MTQKQFKTANNAVFPVLMLIFAYFLLTLGLVALNAGTWRVYIQLIATVIAIVVSIAAYITGKDKRSCSLALLISATVVYTAIALLNRTENTFIYAFAIIIASIAFMNVRLVVIGNAVVIAVNILRLVLHAMSSEFHVDGTQVIVTMFTILLVAVASIRVTQLLLRFNVENLKRANESIEHSVKSVEQQNEMIENTRARFADIRKEMDGLTQNITETENYMSSILDATETISDSINQLSANSEEVVAVSEEGMRASEMSVESMHKCKEILEAIFELAKDLKDSDVA